jgi:hypothetical protein
MWGIGVRTSVISLIQLKGFLVERGGVERDFKEGRRGKI